MGCDDDDYVVNFYTLLKLLGQIDRYIDKQIIAPTQKHGTKKNLELINPNDRLKSTLIPCGPTA